MKTFTLGLNCGGLMEDPEWHIEHICAVEAKNLKDAKQKWAENTNHNDRYWNTETCWAVVEV